jgi:hypothetical protein
MSHQAAAFHESQGNILHYDPVPLHADKDGKPLPQGLYTAEAWLATEGGQRYAATVGFEIRYVY